ncbi:MAG: DUF1844 domain-containing protein [Verrucomicrobia bacterium]|nr:DUF1844 domain-containing protein [Verrucomicrobiota bacterium]
MTTTSDTPASRDEAVATIFASMVMQQTQMTLMLLGQMPHPETGEAITDLEGAKMFIDQLEMLEVKTRGNLGKEEEQLLKQSLVGTRMAFIASIEQQEKAASPAAPPAPAPVADAPAPMAANDVAAAADDDSRKKFSKKY